MARLSQPSPPYLWERLLLWAVLLGCLTPDAAVQAVLASVVRAMAAVVWGA